jgi:hypothetical protein
MCEFLEQAASGLFTGLGTLLVNIFPVKTEELSRILSGFPQLHMPVV